MTRPSAKGSTALRRTPPVTSALPTGTGRDAIRENLRAFIDTGFTAHHDVLEYWDGGALKVFRGVVTMTPDDKSQSVCAGRP